MKSNLDYAKRNQINSFSPIILEDLSQGGNELWHSIELPLIFLQNGTHQIPTLLAPQVSGSLLDLGQNLNKQSPESTTSSSTWGFGDMNAMVDELLEKPVQPKTVFPQAENLTTHSYTSTSDIKDYIIHGWV